MDSRLYQSSEWGRVKWYWATLVTIVAWMASNPASSELAYWTAYYSARLLVWHGLEDAESWATAIGMMAGIGLLGLGMLLLLLVGLRYFGISFREIWGSCHEDFPAAVPVGLGVVLGFLGSLGATGYDEAAVVVVSRVLSQGVVIAVLEEFLFRGFVFRSMLCSFSEGRAVLASSLLFVAPHFYLSISPLSLIIVMALGVTSAILWLRYRTLLVCCLLHGSYNIVTII